jgi:peptidoglycan/LPS O-acetylase OafA/YrhL
VDDAKHATVRQAGESRSAPIESLRALAALSVVVAHVFGTAHDDRWGYLSGSFAHRMIYGGGCGVYLFFALTGYLLFWPFARRHFGDGNPVDLRRYAVNRALRILPLYYVVLVVAMLVQADGGTTAQWVRFLLFGQNFSSATVARVDGPMWSLVVELHFYILLPLLAAAVAWLSRGKPVRAAMALIALGLASLVVHWTMVAGVHHAPDLTWQYSLPAMFLFFVPGMLLALLRLSWERRRPGWLRGPLRRADLWFVAALPVWVLGIDDTRLIALCSIASMLTLGSCVLPLDAGRAVAMLRWRPLAVLGIASYSLYLWHLPIVYWLHPSAASAFAPLLAVSLPLCVAVALLSYRLVEQPFLRMRRSWGAAASPVTVGRDAAATSVS